MSSKKTTEGPDNTQQHPKGFSRRTFLGVSVGTGAVSTAVMGPEAQAAPPGDLAGPGPVSMTLEVNGKAHKVQLEPRVTLIDALRNHLDYNGAKKVCDRATCGSCTVIVDGDAVYACTMLAIEAQGRNIQTVEGLASGDQLHPVQANFVSHDAQQCGFCTPGFVVAAKALLDKNPNPTKAEIEQGLSGNICRCGTYAGMQPALMDAAKQMKGGRRGD